ncbi:peptidylprolyl isomerase [Rickettsiales bacterium]|nr:peptidylprolyl isomerase [Rickettsiales bacterium]
MALSPRSRKNRSKIMIISASILLVAIILIISTFKSDSSNDVVVGTIDGSPVYKKEADNRLKAISNNPNADFDSLDEKSKIFTIREIAGQRALLDQALKEDLEDDSKIQERIEMYRKQILKDTVLSNVVSGLITEDKVKKYYDQLKNHIDGKKEIDTSHILVKTQKEAKAIVKKLDSGSSFSSLAKKHSIDQATADRDGKIGYVLVEKLNPEYAKAALSLKKGGISSPVETPSGWHIIKLDDSREAKAEPYEKVRVQLIKTMSQKAIVDFVNGLIKDSKIELVKEKS